MTDGQWKRCTRATPCRVCGKPDWCCFTHDAAYCMRAEDAPAGWRKIKEPLEGGAVFVDEGAEKAPGYVRTERLPEPEPEVTDWRPYFERFDNAVGPALARCRIDQLLGVSMMSLVTLNIGWCDESRAWTFPMRNHQQRVVGFRKRTFDGAKFAAKGSRAGCFMPSSLVSRWTDPVLVCEGPTDTAAALTLGFSAVGRPSCTGGGSILESLLRGRDVVFVADADGPGRKGAMQAATRIATTARRVRIIQPLRGAKDIREWLRRGASRDEVLVAIDAAFDHEGVDHARHDQGDEGSGYHCTRSHLARAER